jgi:hypothetical protein
MQMKTTIRYPLVPLKMATMKNRTSFHIDVEKLDTLYNVSCEIK